MKLSDEARIVLANIGSGRVLAIARDGSVAKLIPVPRRTPSKQEFIVELAVAEEAIASNQLHELTEDGEPPREQRIRGGGYRMGWAELELPGDRFRLFCCVQ